MPVNILVKLRNKVLANSLSELLVRSSDSYQSFVAQDAVCDSTEPDLILIDAATLKAEFLETWPNAKIILLDTGLQENEIISILLSYRLHGIISTETDTPLFLKALSVIHAGQVWIDNNKLKALLGYAESASSSKSIDKISPKEQEVIILVSQGFKNREIANRLNISEQTVKVHISNIFRKANVTNRAQLVPLAMQFRFSPA